jgi:hypothetical protein
MTDIDQETGEISPHSTQGRILSAMETLKTFPEAMAAVAVGIHDAMEAVRTHHKGAKVTISITIDPFKTKSNAPLIDEPVCIACDVAVKLPKSAPPEQLFFPDSDGNPTRTPIQRQRGLGLGVNVN